MVSTKEQDKPTQSSKAVPRGKPLTPAMTQFVEQKKRVGDAVLLFRMGDFYETFYDDAVLCSKVLGIALTSRDKNSENPIPLAGIPYHALDGYLKKLVDAGYKVAVSEQLEDPKLAQGVVKRDVVRIVTAGTLTDESLLAEQDDNVLAAICVRERKRAPLLTKEGSGEVASQLKNPPQPPLGKRGGKSAQVGLAMIELASGRFEVLDVSPNTLLDELVRMRPAELLIDDDRGGAAETIATELRQICGTSTTRRPEHEFSPYQGERTLLEHFGVSTLSGFGFEKVDTALCAAGVILQYLGETQRTSLDHITAINRRVITDHLQIDHSSWRALEIDQTLRSSSREGTLLWAIDRTVHPIGSRMLRHWLRTALRDVDAIVSRQNAVSLLVDESSVRGTAARRLKDMADVERIAGRVALSRTSPRELGALGRTLAGLPALAAVLEDCRVPFLTDIAEALIGLDDLAALLSRAVHPDAPSTTREGGFMADGFDEELDRLRNVSQNGREWLAAYQKREMERTQIPTLKVGFNRVFGYYIEVSNTGKDRVPPEYVRKQTIKNAERYITDELKQYETEVLTAQDKALSLEVRLFEELRRLVAKDVEALMRVAHAIGRLDCVTSLAALAIERRYVRPEIVEEASLEIRDGRHPVLDQVLGDDFVPNDTTLTGLDSRLLVITGPNMAGKSTYIRQVALLTLLAQTGSFVPAKSMKCSPADRIFARVGSSDEIMRGQSTFMVEMTEAANILHNATERSLVVVDELGRGTSTFDGLSLAWAITEHLATEIKCPTLIATHYHEMTELADLFRGVRNFNVAVREHGDEGIIFLHRIIEGGASKSYGIHVAKLAGIPPTVIRRGSEVLDELQRGFERESRTEQLTRKRTKTDDQLTLFREPGQEIVEELSQIEPDQMTPLDALQRLKEWKDRFG